MLFQSEWSGDVIAAPVWVTDGPEDERSASLGDRMRSPTDIRLYQSHEDLDRCNLAKSPHRRRWTGLLTSLLVGLRSRIHCRREIHRANAAWAMVDDRTL